MRRRKARRRYHPAAGSIPNIIDTGGRISADTRLFVWTRDGGRCRNCGSEHDLHFDHIIPRSLGGSGIAANVELLCEQCNLKKYTRLFVPHVPTIVEERKEF